jgi:hypothetical protein
MNVNHSLLLAVQERVTLAHEFVTAVRSGPATLVLPLAGQPVCREQGGDRVGGCLAAASRAVVLHNKGDVVAGGLAPGGGLAPLVSPLAARQGVHDDAGAANALGRVRNVPVAERYLLTSLPLERSCALRTGHPDPQFAHVLGRRNELFHVQLLRGAGDRYQVALSKIGNAWKVTNGKCEVTEIFGQGQDGRGTEREDEPAFRTW